MPISINPNYSQIHKLNFCGNNYFKNQNKLNNEYLSKDIFVKSQNKNNSIENTINKLNNLNKNQKEEIISHVNSFIQDEIGHIELQKKMIECGINAKDLPEIFDELFTKNPKFKSIKSQTIPDGYLYRFIEKEEYNKLVTGKDVESQASYNHGKRFDVTTNPDLRHNQFARVKFKYTTDAECIKKFKPEFDYYHLYKPAYSLNDVISIDRVLPNGYLEVYSKKQ